MKNCLILAAVISTVIARPLPDVQSAEQHWGDDTTTPFLLSTIPNDQLVASNSQNVAQTGFEQTNAIEPSMPFAMDLQQIAVGGGLPSIQSNEVVNPPTSFDVASPDLSSSSSFPSTDPGGLTEAFSGSPGSDSNKGTELAAGLAPGSSSSPPPATSPGSTLDQAPQDINSLFDTTGIYDGKR